MDNSNEYIKALLDKYWEGDTSLEEELQLHLYFNQSKVDPALKTFQPLFDYFKNEKGISIDLSDEVMSKINAVEQKVAPVAKPVTRIISLGWQRAVAIAASLLLVLTLGINIYQNQKSASTEMITMDTFQSPEQALEQTKAALLYLSNRMNKATDKATLSISKTAPLDLSPKFKNMVSFHAPNTLWLPDHPGLHPAANLVDGVDANSTSRDSS